MIKDAFRFLFWNIYHYAFAVWGFRLRLDPDYPGVLRFFPGLIFDSVFEWRTYGGMPLVALMAVGVASIHEYLAWALIVFWFFRSYHRSKFFICNLTFWKQAFLESPRKHRVRVHYEEWLIREMENAWKRGDRWTAYELEKEAVKVQNLICGGPLRMETVRELKDLKGQL